MLVAGQTTQFKFRIEMHHPEIELMAEEESPAANLSIVPVYPLTEGVSQKTFRKYPVRRLTSMPPTCPIISPVALRAKYSLAGLGESFARIHYPDNSDRFEDLLQLHLAVAPPYRV